MDINSLHLFLDVVGSGSFSETGRRLSLASSSVSRQVTQLELDLGVTLFTRTTRQLALTEAGQVLQERARTILSEIEETRTAVQDLEQNPKGTLRITAPLALGRLHIGRAAIDYMAAWPEVNVEIDLSDQVVDLVERDVDVAVRIGTLDDSTLVARRLGGVRRFAYASPEYLSTAGTPTTPAELRLHNCLAFHPQGLSPLWRESADLWRFEKDGHVEEISVRGNFKANASDVIVQAALAGKGIMLMLDWIVGEHVNSGKLVPLLADWIAAPYAGDAAAFAVYPAGRQAPAKVRTFIDHLQKYFETNLRTN